MGSNINIHLPPGVTDLNDLSLNDFVSQTKTDGKTKTTDLYFHPARPKTAGQKIMQKLASFSARFDHWKPAMKSGNLENAFMNIHGQNRILGMDTVHNMFSHTMKLAAENGGELKANGTTIKLVNADDYFLMEQMTNKAMRE